jgi:hypothetical protein
MLDPIRRKERRLIALPRCRKSRMLIDDPSRVIPYTANDDPKRK